MLHEKKKGKIVKQIYIFPRSPPPPSPQKLTTTKQNQKYGKWLTKSAYSKAKQVFLGFVFQAVGFNFVPAFIENSIKTFYPTEHVQ